MYAFLPPSCLCRGFQWNFFPTPASSFFNCILEPGDLNRHMYDGYNLFKGSRTF